MSFDSFFLSCKLILKEDEKDEIKKARLNTEKETEYRRPPFGNGRRQTGTLAKYSRYFAYAPRGMPRDEGKRKRQPRVNELMKPEDLSFLDIDRLATILDLPKGFIYEHTRKGTRDALPCFRFGKHLRFRENEVLEWIEKHRKK